MGDAVFVDCVDLESSNMPRIRSDRHSNLGVYIHYDTMNLTKIVRRGSDGSASACCKAGPSSILGSAPQEGVSPLSRQAMRKWREASANGNGELYCMNVIE
jgi:hypothetical protein